MGEPVHLSYSEIVTRKGGIEQAAKSWAEYMDFVNQSETKKAFMDPTYFQQQIEPLYAGRMKRIAEEFSTAGEQARAAKYSRGLLGSGLADQASASLGVAQVERGAQLRAELEAGAEQKRVANEGRWLSMMGRLGELEANVLSQNMAMAARMGEAEYRDPVLYQTNSPYAERFHREVSNLWA